MQKKIDTFLIRYQTLYSENKVIFVLSYLHTNIYYALRFYFPYLSSLAQPVTIFVYEPVVYGPVHILPYDPQCHELFAIDDIWQK